MKIIKISQINSILDNFTGIVECENGDKFWYKEGKLHREDGPAVEFPNREKSWYIKGKLHRIDGPAVEYPNGTKFWYKEGKRHREDGPAIECSDGTKEWCIEGKYHRLDGPAVEFTDGTKEWWIENQLYSSEKLLKLINSSFFLGKEKGRYNLESLKFLTEKGIEKFPILPGMEEYEDFKRVFEELENKRNNK